MNPQERVTAILTDGAHGVPNRELVDRLMPLIYDDLHAAAERLMRRERKDHTLAPTAVVHEAYLRLVDQSRVDWKGRTHFLAVASFAMRRLLMEHARYKNRQKRGGGWHKVTLHEGAVGKDGSDYDVVDLDDALARLAEGAPRKAQVVEMKFFGGMKDEEIATALGISTRSVERDWRFARAWLLSELT